MEKVIQYRRALHRIPELGFDLPLTVAFVRDTLAPLPCSLSSPAQSSLCAFFDAGRDDTIALRADMDALPITEQTNCEYASRHPGKMHACGHDAHTAMLLSVAEYIAENLVNLPHNVLLIFEPAEETDGGARLICDSGILEEKKVFAVFGIHMWPGLPAGVVASRENELMAQSAEVTVSFFGRSAHVAKAEEGADALLSGAQFLLAAYAAEREIAPPDCLRLLKFGRMKSGKTGNIISNHAELFGTVRVFSPALMERFQSKLRELAMQAAAETGCTAEITFSEGYPPVINDPKLLRRVRAWIGSDLVELPAPFMTAEDFSFYGQRSPAVFFFLGTGREHPLHSAEFDFDETALGCGVEFYKKLIRIPALLRR